MLGRGVNKFIFFFYYSFKEGCRYNKWIKERDFFNKVFYLFFYKEVFRDYLIWDLSFRLLVDLFYIFLLMVFSE